MAPTRPLSLKKSSGLELPNADVLSLFRHTTCSAGASAHYNTLKHCIYLHFCKNRLLFGRRSAFDQKIYRKYNRKPRPPYFLSVVRHFYLRFVLRVQFCSVRFFLIIPALHRPYFLWKCLRLSFLALLSPLNSSSPAAVHSLRIRESVDSLCRDGADTPIKH